MLLFVCTAEQHSAHSVGAFYIFQVCLLMMKPLQKSHTIRKQLSSSNLFMSDMLFLMKALAALHNQLAISELIFHPAIVMSSPGAGIIHNSLCYDKLWPQAREVYERFWAHVKSMPFVLEQSLSACWLIIWNKGWHQTTNRSGPFE